MAVIELAKEIELATPTPVKSKLTQL